MSNIYFGRVYRILPNHDTEAAQQFADQKIAEKTPAKAGLGDFAQYVYTNEPNLDGSKNQALDVFTRYQEASTKAQEPVSFKETAAQYGLDPAAATIGEFMDKYQRAEVAFNARQDLRILEERAIDVFKQSNGSFSILSLTPRGTRRQRRQGLQRKDV